MPKEAEVLFLLNKNHSVEPQQRSKGWRNQDIKRCGERGTVKQEKMQTEEDQARKTKFLKYVNVVFEDVKS